TDTAESSDATGTTDATSTTATSGGFIQGDAVGEGMCDVWSPMDCGEEEKCMPYASMGETWDALKCSPLVENPKTLGDECFAEEGPAGGVDDCDDGLFCYYVNSDT